jgi:hypothetical protein
VPSEYLEGNGWKKRMDLEMHSHGFVTSRYRYGKFDALYINRTLIGGRQVSIGDRGRREFGGNRDNFSPQDTSLKREKWLATPDGMRHFYKNGSGKWQNDTVIRL